MEYWQMQKFRFALLFLLLLTPLTISHAKTTSESQVISVENIEELMRQDVSHQMEDAKIYDMDWLSDSAELFAVYNGYPNNGVWVYDTHNIQEPIRFLSGNGVFSPDGKYWAVQTVDEAQQITNVFDVISGEPISTMTHGAAVLEDKGAIAFSPDSSLIASGWYGQTDLWSLNNDKTKETLRADSGLISSLDFNSSGTLLVAADEGGQIIVWDIESGELITTRHDHFNLAFAVFIPNQNYVISRSVDRSVTLFNALTDERLISVDSHSDLMYAALSESRFIVSDASVRQNRAYSVLTFWDIDSRSRIIEFTLPNEDFGSFIPGSITLHSTGDLLAFWNTGEQLTLIDISGGKELHTLRVNAPIRGAEFSPLNKLLALWTEADTIQFWNSETGEMLSEITNESVIDLMFSPDGTKLITASQSGDIKVWQIAA
jgi:WD40 repeat protein